MKVGDVVRVKLGTVDYDGIKVNYSGVKVKILHIEKEYSIVDVLSEDVKKLNGCSLEHAAIPNWALVGDKSELVLEVE